jgi:hypothetical protein
MDFGHRRRRSSSMLAASRWEQFTNGTIRLRASLPRRPGGPPGLPGASAPIALSLNTGLAPASPGGQRPEIAPPRRTRAAEPGRAGRSQPRSCLSRTGWARPRGVLQAHRPLLHANAACLPHHGTASPDRQAAAGRGVARSADRADLWPGAARPTNVCTVARSGLMSGFRSRRPTVQMPLPPRARTCGR